MLFYLLKLPFFNLLYVKFTNHLQSALAFSIYHPPLTVVENMLTFTSKLQKEQRVLVQSSFHVFLLFSFMLILYFVSFEPFFKRIPKVYILFQCPPFLSNDIPRQNQDLFRTPHHLSSSCLIILLIMTLLQLFLCAINLTVSRRTKQNFFHMYVSDLFSHA